MGPNIRCLLYAPLDQLLGYSRQHHTMQPKLKSIWTCQILHEEGGLLRMLYRVLELTVQETVQETCKRKYKRQAACGVPHGQMDLLFFH